jgi:hypothetical protein
MKTLLKMASGIFTAGILLLASTASAAPVVFSITGVAFTPGSGYGQDANENSATLLDVRFSTSGFVAQNFTLSGANSFTTFTFGTVALWEPDAHTGIEASEMDNLTVTASFTFVSPVGTPQTLFATGTAIAGSVSDSFPDYTIDWAPIFVPFGTGGLFQIDLNDLGFTDNGGGQSGQVQTQTATIKLLNESTTPTGVVPEPSTIALLGLGLLGAAFGRRKPGAGSA